MQQLPLNRRCYWRATVRIFLQTLPEETLPEESIVHISLSGWYCSLLDLFLIVPTMFQTILQQLDLFLSQSRAFLAKPFLLHNGLERLFLLCNFQLELFQLGFQQGPLVGCRLKTGRRRFIVLRDGFQAGLGPSSTTSRQCLQARRCDGDLVTNDLFSHPRKVIVKLKLNKARDTADQELARNGFLAGIDTTTFLLSS
jgi:hypothetical protein